MVFHGWLFLDYAVNGASEFGLHYCIPNSIANVLERGIIPAYLTVSVSLLYFNQSFL